MKNSGTKKFDFLKKSSKLSKFDLKSIFVRTDTQKWKKIEKNYNILTKTKFFERFFRSKIYIELLSIIYCHQKYNINNSSIKLDIFLQISVIHVVKIEENIKNQ